MNVYPSEDPYNRFFPYSAGDEDDPEDNDLYDDDFDNYEDDFDDD
jgi:hypothetical protein